MRRFRTSTRAVTKAAFIGFGFVFLAGCQEFKPEVVTVDLSQVARPSVPRPAPTLTAQAPASAPLNLRAEGAAPIQTKRGLDSREVNDAFRQIEQRRRQTALRLNEIAEQATEQQARALRESLASNRDQEYYQWLDEAAARTRIPFEKSAPRLGVLRRELANLVIFPGTKPRTAPRDAVAERDQARAAQIVAEIEALDAEYRAAIRAIYAEVDRRLRERERSDEASVAAFRAEARSASLRAQRALLADPTNQPGAFSNPGAGASVPGVAGRSIRTPGATGDKIEMKGSSPTIPSDVILQRDLDIWLSLKGYRLAKPGERGSDRTNEFIQWRTQNSFGP